MARLVNRLTPAAVKAIVAARKPGLYPDGAGLGIRIGGGGAASWVLRYQRRGKAHEMGIGPTHTLALSEARERARRHRQELLDGIDPLAQRRAAKAAAEPLVTFAKAAAAYIESHSSSWRSAVHRQQWDSTLRDYVLPMIGGKCVTDIVVDDVLAIVSPIWQAKHETASRVRGRIELVLDYATARGWRSGPNPAVWRGHLSNLLPARTKATEHHAALPWQDVPAFLAALRQRQGVAARAVELCVLTACRSGEVRGARWLEISGRVWEISGDRMKARRPHRIPLSDAAAAVIEAMAQQRQDGADLIFPGQAAGKPLSDVALAKIAKDCAPGLEFTLHGFRSSFRDWAGETTTYTREVIEMALAHRLGDKAEQAYARGDLFKKRTQLMADWSAFCGSAASNE